MTKTKSLATLSLLALVTIWGSVSTAFYPSQRPNQWAPYYQAPQYQSGNRRDNGQDQSGDGQVVDANRRHLSHVWVQGAGMRVVALLPDDNQGLRHQKWTVQLSDGSTIMGVYNSDIADRVPLHVGDVVSMGGEFISDPRGNLMHWLHAEPCPNSPNPHRDGFVDLNGVRYGAITHPDRQCR